MRSGKYLGVKYSRSKTTQRNWGDALNAYLIPKLSGRKIIHFSEYYNTGLYPTLGGIGSILDNNAVRNLYVWGSGLKSPDSNIPVLPRKIFAVRGYLTQRRFKDLNVPCPDVFGDPAVVLPRFYQSRLKAKKYKVGIVPHYVDKGSQAIRPLLNNPEVCFIDIESGIEEFIDQICACEVIASSSLHGLIAADAYGIPRVWLRLSDGISGGDFKFQDYFSTTDIPVIQACSPDSSGDFHKLLEQARQPQRIADAEALLNAFPF